MGTRATVGFLFLADQIPTPWGRYDTVPKQRLFRRVLEQDASGALEFRVLSGDLPLRHLAYRVSEAGVTIEDGRVRGSSRVMTADMDLYALLVWDFVDSASYGWTTLDMDDTTATTLLVARHTVYAIALDAVDRGLAAACDAEFAGSPWYIGAVEFDRGNPLHLRLLALPHTLTYRRRELFAIDDLSEEGYVSEALAITKHWASDLEFTSIGTESSWVDYEAREAAGDMTLSERGALSARRLTARADIGYFDRVAAALSQPAPARENEIAATSTLRRVLTDPVVPRDKLVNYALTEDPTRRDGFNKAQVFRSALGISAPDWRFLATQLASGVGAADPEEVRSTSHGVKFKTVIPVRGRNGRVVPVVAAWIIEADQPARLTTTHVADTRTPLPDVEPTDVPVLPPAQNDDWSALYAAAIAAADLAAEATVPTPMFLDGYDPVDEGMCGGASVVIPDARRSFPRWLLQNGYASRRFGLGGVAVYASITSQSAERARSWADAFARVIRANGIECTVDAYLD